tara:strand:+ start:299 stop:760 length:462 start_codon:yes stop_codon:yes gene_type:complete
MEINNCPICLEEIYDNNIQPCNCKNGIHINCLIKWINYKNSIVCEICNIEYKINKDILDEYLIQENYELNIERNYQLEIENNYELNIENNYELDIEEMENIEEHIENNYIKKCGNYCKNYCNKLYDICSYTCPLIFMMGGVFLVILIYNKGKI